MRKLIAQLFRDEDGATAIEYGLIAALISVVIIVGLTAVGNKLEAVFEGVAGQLNAPGGG